MHFKDTDTVFHDHFENRHGEPRHPVCDAHSGILSVDDACRRDTLRVLKEGGDELASCLPMVAPKVSTSSAHPMVWLDEQIFRGLQERFSVAYSMPCPVQASTNC